MFSWDLFNCRFALSSTYPIGTFTQFHSPWAATYQEILLQYSEGSWRRSEGWFKTWDLVLNTYLVNSWGKLFRTGKGGIYSLSLPKAKPKFVHLCPTGNLWMLKFWAGIRCWLLFNMLFTFSTIPKIFQTFIQLDL